MKNLNNKKIILFGILFTLMFSFGASVSANYYPTAGYGMYYGTDPDVISTQRMLDKLNAETQAQNNNYNIYNATPNYSYQNPNNNYVVTNYAQTNYVPPITNSYIAQAPIDSNVVNNNTVTTNTTTKNTTTTTTKRPLVNVKAINSSNTDEKVDTTVTNQDSTLASNQNNLTALSVAGYSGFLPNTVFEWFLTVILILIIIILIRQFRKRDSQEYQEEYNQ